MLKADAQSTRSTHRAGRFWVRRGAGPVAAALALVFRLPRPGDAVPVTFHIDRDGAWEHWHRTFDGKPLTTRVRPGPAHTLIERIGGLEMRHAVVQAGETTRYSLSRARLCSIPVPRALLPRVLSLHTERGDRAHVYTLVSFRGRLVLAYAGWIA